MMSEAAIDSWGTLWWGADAGRLAERRAAEPRMSLDAELVDRCLNGDRGAWEQLVQSHTRLVYGACYRLRIRPKSRAI